MENTISVAEKGAFEKFITRMDVVGIIATIFYYVWVVESS